MTVWNLLIERINHWETNPESEQMEDIVTVVLVGLLVILTIGSIL